MEITIKKGLDLRLVGSVDNDVAPIKVKPGCIAVCPDDFEGFLPKTDVKIGQTVKAGDSILHHKDDENIKIVSPVAGTVRDIERGSRRHIERIVIDCDDDCTAASKAEIPSNLAAGPEEILKFLSTSGLLVFIRRRPFADIPSASVRPRDIFVSAFDSAPLAADRRWTSADAAALQAGASLLAAVTEGKVYVTHRDGTDFPELKDVVSVNVKGPHPAGLPGIQAAAIRPVNKGETVWTLSAETMWRIGRMLLTGIFDGSTQVAVTGSCITEPYVADTVIGADTEALLKGRIREDSGNKRVISGNVLTGIKIGGNDHFLHYPYTQLTVIPEGDDKDEFMGWASLSPKKLSVSPSYPGKFLRRLFSPDARINGGRRAIIMSGEYDRVFPMDIYAEYLIKATRNRDIAAMEKLGIYEVAPEDFALAEFVDSSKQPLQQIIREGLDYLRKELQ